MNQLLGEASIFLDHFSGPLWFWLLFGQFLWFCGLWEKPGTQIW